MTARGVDIDFESGRLNIRREGELEKFVPRVTEIRFSGRLARERGQSVRFTTERAVSALTDDGVTLIEIADRADLERDVIGRMASGQRSLGTCDPWNHAIFRAEPMGLAAAFAETVRSGAADA
jgi:propionate CoA-transferase